MKNSRLPISVVVLTRNEERNVSECLQSCDFAEEIVVVDDDSTDQTVAIVKRNDFFPGKRNETWNWVLKPEF